MFEAIVETLPAQLIVIDPQTHDVLYANAAARRMREKSRQGGKCYTILGKTAPCDFCETGRISPDDYLQSERDGSDGRRFTLWTKLIPWNGRMARLEIVLDITEHALLQQQLEKDLRRKNLITRTARELYASEELDAGLASVLRMTGRYLRAERSCVFELRDDTLVCTHEWRSRSTTPPAGRLQHISVDAIRQWIARLEQRETIHVADLRLLQREQPDACDFLNRYAIRSLVLAPLTIGNRLIGLMGADNFPMERANDALALLTTISNFCSTAIWRGRTLAQLRQAGYCDLLTSLLNRNAFIRDIKTPHMMPLGVIYVDLNGLKQVNDEQSHNAGDAMLIDAAQTLQQALPEGKCYRIGGDEYVIILQGVEKRDFQRKLALLKGIFTFRKQYSASVGGAWHSAPDNITDVVAAADAEMYREKQRHYGRKAQKLRMPLLQQAACQKDEFQQRLESSGVELCWLPRHAPADGRVIGLEALARMRGMKGIVMPENFLPILEQTRRAHLLDFAVFERVCAQLRRWMDMDIPIVPAAVNFSRHTLLRPDLFNVLQQTSSRYSIPLHFLEIDIPATVPQNEYDNNCILYDAVRRLYKYGFSIAIDGFALENANLALLSQVDFNTIKLDSSILRMVDGNTNLEDMLSLVFALTRKSSILVEAKGVENERQRARLASLRCDAAQGYLFSRPMTSEGCERLLRSRS